MFDIFNKQSALPPVIMMHSYGNCEKIETNISGGHADMAKSLYKSSKFGSRIYFSFSSVINMRSPKTPDVIKVEENLL